MQIQIFSIPMLGGEDELNELNHFLRAHRVADIRKEFVQKGDMCYWTFCITHLDTVAIKTPEPEQRKGKIDYREVLEEHIFARFCEMRKIRKEIAEKEAIPPFAVFTDAELSEIAKQENPSLQSLKTIHGIGAKKIEKYGSYFCGLNNETNWESDKSDS